MSNAIITGHVSFVNHDKKYIIIEYEVNGKKKVVNGSVDEKSLIKKHVFHIGDAVSFMVGLSGRGTEWWHPIFNTCTIMPWMCLSTKPEQKIILLVT